MISLDKSKILLGEPIVINDFITIQQPRVGEIIRNDERKYFSTFHSLSSIPSDMKSPLWDVGIDFTKISDWELFISLSRMFKQEDTQLIFGNIDFSSAELIVNNETGKTELLLEQGVIDEETYNQFIPYVREMVGYVLKREKPQNKITKMVMIDEDRLNRAHPKKNADESFLFSMIISLVNTEEFSYNYETVKDITVYQLMKSFVQIQNKKSACALYQGSMSGFVDTSKINKSNFSWVYSEDKFKS